MLSVLSQVENMMIWEPLCKHWALMPWFVFFPAYVALKLRFPAVLPDFSSPCHLLIGLFIVLELVFFLNFKKKPEELDYVKQERDLLLHL